MFQKCALILPAGGTSSRYGRTNKLLEMLGSYPVFIHAIRNFSTVIPFGNMVIPAHPSFLKQYQTALKKFLPEAEAIRFVPGGATRTDSIANALEELPSSIEMTAVHDAARPLADGTLLIRCIEACLKYSAAAAAHREVNTVKIIGTDGLLSSGPDRSVLWPVETPQVFRHELLLRATRCARQENKAFTDDTAAVEFYCGIRTFPVENKIQNPKITLPEDLVLAEALLRMKRDTHS